jgi:hypothetical protein
MIQFHTLQQTLNRPVHSISGDRRTGQVALVGAGPGDPRAADAESPASAAADRRGAV